MSSSLKMPTKQAKIKIALLVAKTPIWRKCPSKTKHPFLDKICVCATNHSKRRNVNDWVKFRKESARFEVFYLADRSVQLIDCRYVSARRSAQ